MTLVVIGINHRTAPVEIREKVVFAATDLPEALRNLKAVPGVRESVIVSTCNRTELYCFTDHPFTDTPGAPVADWLGDWHDLASQNLDLRDSLYQLHGRSAVEHVFSVACGLDSLVLGEPQILGQLKDAYRAALDHGVTGPYLNRLLQTAFSVAKRVRTETRIGANAVSVASATVAMARTVFEDFDQHTALLVGAGETIALAARHLHANGLRRMIIANRSLERAQELAKEFDGYAIGLEALATHLPEADIVISSTASPTPVITYDAVRAALRARRRKPMFMADIAVPRDIETEVAKLEDVYLFTVDDLQNVVNENIESRREAARDAGQMIAAEIAQFEQQLKTLDAVPTIRQLRHDADVLRSQTTEQARRMLAAGRDAGEVIDFLAATLTNRLLHGPSQRLREAAERGDAEIVAAAKALLVSEQTRPEGEDLHGGHGEHGAETEKTSVR
ncbi:MAG TPA: glutamyl-tRNA reductase [Povalibacter sp.]|uniref:glutamyl-tRNA reductase n=1 Tax=Povalibacter sp. TaxID=1962978 RepID=UPI002BA57281|nr:glutamyl-tRNA reductase [Povalibacter sp.]HMN46409.1 glutamyl-tRNA reductase [Povalibacter sp.]